MKYEVILNGKKYEVEVEEGKAILLNETAYTPAAAPGWLPGTWHAPGPPSSASWLSAEQRHCAAHPPRYTLRGIWESGRSDPDAYWD